MYLRVGYETVVELLIAKKAKVKAEDENKWTPLHFAAKGNSSGNKDFEYLSIMYFLGNYNQFISLGHVNIAKVLLSQGADINAKTNNNQTALLVAIQHGNFIFISKIYP